MQTEQEKRGGWRELLRRVHRDEHGAVSIETVLIVAAIALPVLIFILKFGWPKIRDFFNRGMDDLDGTAKGISNGTN